MKRRMRTHTPMNIENEVIDEVKEEDGEEESSEDELTIQKRSFLRNKLRRSD
jgi:hypothetical protein